MAVELTTARYGHGLLDCVMYEVSGICGMVRYGALSIQKTAEQKLGGKPG